MVTPLIQAGVFSIGLATMLVSNAVAGPFEKYVDRIVDSRLTEMSLRNAGVAPDSQQSKYAKDIVKGTLGTKQQGFDLQREVSRELDDGARRAIHNGGASNSRTEVHVESKDNEKIAGMLTRAQSADSTGQFYIGSELLFYYGRDEGLPLIRGSV